MSEHARLTAVAHEKEMLAEGMSVHPDDYHRLLAISDLTATAIESRDIRQIQAALVAAAEIEHLSSKRAASYERMTTEYNNLIGMCLDEIELQGRSV
jgi:hypothetical protein